MMGPKQEAQADGVRALASRDATPEFLARLANRHIHLDAAYRPWRDLWLSESFRSWSIEPLLRDIRAPLLLLQGTADEFGTEEQVKRIVAAGSGSASSRMLEGLGHSPHLQQPDMVFGIIADHLGLD